MAADYDAAACALRNPHCGPQQYFGWLRKRSSHVLRLWVELDTYCLEQIVNHTPGGPGAWWDFYFECWAGVEARVVASVLRGLCDEGVLRVVCWCGDVCCWHCYGDIWRWWRGGALVSSVFSMRLGCLLACACEEGEAVEKEGRCQKESEKAFFGVKMEVARLVRCFSASFCMLGETGGI